MSYQELLLGCGHSREKRIVPTLDRPREYGDPMWCNLTTLDINPECQPDIIFDLSLNALPCNESLYNEIHAYEVLEHFGHQGNIRQFFELFSEFWRVLKPNGYLCATVPHWKSIWAWGDPGHTRVISAATLVFLDQEEYKLQLGKTAMSDYRKELGTTNFKRVHQQVKGDLFEFVLQAVK